MQGVEWIRRIRYLSGLVPCSFSQSFLIKLRKVRCFVGGRDLAFRFTTHDSGDVGPGLRICGREKANGRKRGNLLVNLHKIRFFDAFLLIRWSGRIGMCGHSFHPRHAKSELHYLTKKKMEMNGASWAAGDRGSVRLSILSRFPFDFAPTASRGRLFAACRVAGKPMDGTVKQGQGSAVGFGHPMRTSAAAEAVGHAEPVRRRKGRGLRERRRVRFR